MMTSLGSTFNMVGGHVWPFNMDTYLHYDLNIKHACQLQNKQGKWLQPQVGIVNHLVPIVWFVS